MNRQELELELGTRLKCSVQEIFFILYDKDILMLHNFLSMDKEIYPEITNDFGKCLDLNKKIKATTKGHNLQNENIFILFIILEFYNNLLQQLSGSTFLDPKIILDLIAILRIKQNHFVLSPVMEELSKKEVSIFVKEIKAKQQKK